MDYLVFEFWYVLCGILVSVEGDGFVFDFFDCVLVLYVLGIYVCVGE